MEFVASIFKEKFSQIPTKKFPKIAQNNTDKYMETSEAEFNLQESKGNTLWALMGDKTNFHTDEGLYIRNHGCYIFLCESKLKDKHIVDEKVSAFLQKLISKQLLTIGMEIGLILWLQGTVVTVTITNSIYRALTRDLNLIRADFTRLYNLRLKIGSTITLSMLNEWKNRKLPIQVFLGPRISPTAHLGGGDTGDDPCCRKFANNTGSRQDRVKLLTNTVSNYNLPLYIHAPYNFNLCVPKIHLDGIIIDLQDGQTIGAKGVVIHVGKNISASKGSSNIPLAVAEGRMHDNVAKLLKYASVDCKLLVETPAGQGSEILTDAEQMVRFYQSFTQEEKEKMGICVDTCHVFAVGYNPLSYLQYLENHLPGVIKLVHYNDSVNCRGCCVDRHFPAGGGFNKLKEIANGGPVPAISIPGELGHIGVKRLASVAEWCLLHQIPMVTE